MDRIDIQQYWFDHGNFKDCPNSNAEKEFLKMYRMKSLPVTKGKYSKSVLNAARLMINAITQGSYGIIMEDSTRYDFGSVYAYAMYNNYTGSKVLKLGAYIIEDYVTWVIQQFSAVLNLFTFKHSNITAIRGTMLLYTAKMDEDTLRSAISDIFKQTTKILFRKAGNTSEFINLLFIRSGSKTLRDIAEMGLTSTEYLDMLNVELPHISDAKKIFGDLFAVLNDNTVLYLQDDGHADLLPTQDFEAMLAFNKLIKQEGASANVDCVRAGAFL